MAFRKSVKRNPDLLKNISFDGGIQSHTRCILIKEFIKYILYERQQIPVPYHQIKLDQKSADQQLSKNGRKTSLVSKMEHKKITNLITHLDILFDKLVETFEMCPEIHQVLLVLGGTVVSPKESYCITLPPYDPELNNLSSKSCIRQLIKELISEDIVGKFKDLKITNINLLIKAPINSGIAWFIPKPNYTMPERGSRFKLHMSCNSNSETFLHDLTHEESEIEISGIEPFNLSAMDASLDEQMTKLFISSDDESDKKHEFKKHPVIVSVEKKKRLSSMSQRLDTISELQVESNETNIETISKNERDQEVLHNDILSPHLDDEIVFNVGRDHKLSSGSLPTSQSEEDNTLLQKTLDNSESLVESELTCIWFQAPTVIKGYKDKTSKSVSSGTF